ncbi:CRISPR-associated helicase/endonuclease Cas3 [Prodigiosinella confusarubida]
MMTENNKNGSVPLYYLYWGKANRSSEHNTDDEYHLLPYHCLDVAACGYWLVKQNRFQAQDIMQSLGLTGDAAALWLAWFLAWHDIGKFARGFQQLYSCPDSPLVKPAGKAYLERHDSLGFWLWNEVLYDRWQTDPTWLPHATVPEKMERSIEIWMRLVCGHHGKPPLHKESLSPAFHADDYQAAQDYLTELHSVFPSLTEFPSQFADKNWRQQLIQHSWSLAGIVVLADWLGSHQDDFPYRAQPISLVEYWHQHALPQAKIAVCRLPSVPVVKPFQGISGLFPFIQQPTPLQQQALAVDITTPGPQLFILEDVTGAGKTEAAMILAHRLMSQQKGQGIYVGLPTMATANAMYQRLSRAYRALYVEEHQPSLMLAHGAREMVTAFRQSLWSEDNRGQAQYDQDESSASAACNNWFADSRKKALLADVGVGTLDQALMAVMPYRHQSLRLLGLCNKILLLDEVHAYDAYMSKILENLLAFHARQGGSAVILTATLSSSQRERLLQAFHQGMNAPAIPLHPAEDAGYPWFTHLTQQHLTELSLATRPEVQRSVQIHWLTQREQGIDIIRQALDAGQCVCWIRNTVDDAIAVYQQLRQSTWLPQENLLLFHSRFAFCDRLEIEQQALAWFGKSDQAPQRRGKVLIATQVVEQSLDIDVDVMISDLAPVDLLIQRAGRLQRHIRALDGRCKTNLDAEPLHDERPAATLHVLAPEWQPEAEASWLGSELRHSGFVYPDHAVLWRTQAVLRDSGAIRMPEDARMLIESVYEEQIPAPAALQDIANQVLGNTYSQRSVAKQSSLTMAQGYSITSSDRGWGEEVDIFTRLGAASIDVYLAWQPATDNELPQPYAGTGEFGWDKSRLSVRESWWQKHEKALPVLRDERLERFRQCLHRPTAQVLLLTPGETPAFYRQETGLTAPE